MISIPTVDLTAAFICPLEKNIGGQRQEGQKYDTPVYPQYSVICQWEFLLYFCTLSQTSLAKHTATHPSLNPNSTHPALNRAQACSTVLSKGRNSVISPKSNQICRSGEKGTPRWASFIEVCFYKPLPGKSCALGLKEGELIRNGCP